MLNQLLLNGLVLNAGALTNQKKRQRGVAMSEECDHKWIWGGVEEDDCVEYCEKCGEMA